VRATLRDRLEYAAIRAAFWLVSVLPEALAYRIAGCLGAFYVRLSPRRQRTALRLLHNAYPRAADDAELLALARRGTGNLVKVALDMARVDRMLRSGRFQARIEVDELLAAAPDGPWLGVTGHLGSWECGAIAVAQSTGRKTHVTARLMKNPLADRWLRASRQRAGLVVHDRRGGIRPLARALESGSAALQVVDQNQRLRGVFAPFFGELASTERAAATLAVRKGYPVMVAAGVRTGIGFRFRFVVQEILWPERTGEVPADVQRMVERINRSLEALILRFPEQYLWIHDRYRTRPGGEAEQQPAEGADLGP
jgi:KDO2-lipid IV(A) lauroyltransferase